MGLAKSAWKEDPVELDCWLLCVVNPKFILCKCLRYCAITSHFIVTCFCLIYNRLEFQFVYINIKNLKLVGFFTCKKSSWFMRRWHHVIIKPWFLKWLYITFDKILVISKYYSNFKCLPTKIPCCNIDSTFFA